MPYASSIQIANDANGAAHAFLADNGAIWQCQWNAQAQRWDQGQLVPLAFGGDKLDALYLENLWPTQSGSIQGFNPGIVLAYRVGEGSSAEVFASFGQWGGDGELGWSAPVQLTNDQVDDQAFALVSAPTATGGFSIVVQKKETGTPVDAILDQLSKEKPDVLEPKLEAALRNNRKDSDLYVTQFNLTSSSTNPGEVLLKSNAATINSTSSSGTPVVAAPAEPAAAGPTSPFNGNNQLSREQLRGLAAPAPASDVQASRFSEDFDSTQGDSSPADTESPQAQPFESTSIQSVTTQSSSPQSSSPQSASRQSSSNPLLKKFNLKGGGSIDAGVAKGQSFMRWELNIPTNWTNGPGKYADRPQPDWGNEYTASEIDPADLSARGSFAQSVLSESSSELSMGPVGEGAQKISLLDGIYEEVLDQNYPSGLIKSSSTESIWEKSIFGLGDNGEQETTGLNLKLRGGFGLGNFGANGLTSFSTSKLIIGAGTEDTASIVQKGKGLMTPNQAGGWNIGGGGSIQTIYNYQNGNLFQKTNTLLGTYARESAGLDFSFRGFKTFKALEARGRLSTSLSTGYEFSQSMQDDPSPNWLAQLGLYGGAAGRLERDLLTTQGFANKLKMYRYKPTHMQPPIEVMGAAQNSKNSYLSGGEAVFWMGALNAVVGSALAAVGPATVNNYYKNSKQPGAVFSHSTGSQVGARITAAILMYGLVGVEGNIANRWSKFFTGNKKGTGEDTFFANFGVALPMGGMVPLFSYGHTWGAKPTTGSSSTPPSTTTGVGATQENTVSTSTITSSGLYRQAGSGADYPFTYEPSAGSNSYFSPNESGAALGVTPSYLQLLTLGTTAQGEINPKGTKGYALTLVNTGLNLKDGSYTKVPIIGVTLSGTLKTAAIASFQVSEGAIVLDSFLISESGQYLALPQSEADSGTYELLLDVYSADAVNSSSPELSAGINPFLTYPTVSLDVSVDPDLLLTQKIQSIQTVDIPDDGQPGSQSASTIYLPYDPATQDTIQLPANSNESYTYTDVGILIPSSLTALQSPTGNLTTPPSGFIDSGVTATVHVSNGVIYRVDLSEPVYFVPPFAQQNQSNSYSIQLVLPSSVVSGITQPTYTVHSELLGFNNFVDDESFSAQPGKPNSGVYLAAGISDELPLNTLMGSLPVQNRVSYINEDGSLVYLNGINEDYNPTTQEYSYSPLIETYPSEISLFEANKDAGKNLYNGFTAASTPTAVSMYGTAPGESELSEPYTLVAWVEASKKVKPISTTQGGTADYQAFMDDLYGNQQINFRINRGGKQGWQAPTFDDLYHPSSAVIRHLKAFNVEVAGVLQTLLVWTETSIPAIKGEISTKASGQLSPAVLKTAWINPNPLYTNWEYLTGFSDQAGKLVSTIQTIPWDPAQDVGLSIDNLSVASIAGIVNDQLTETAVVSWSQDVRTPYRQSVLDSKPIIYLQFGELQSGLSDINIGSVDSVYTTTSASSTGLSFAVPGALPKSQASAVQNIHGTGVLSTGLGTNFSKVRQIVNDIPVDTITNTVDTAAIAEFTGSIKGNTLSVTTLLSGTLDVGDIITGPGIKAGTTIQTIPDPSSSLGDYTLSTNHEQVASTSLEAVPPSGNLALTTFSGSIDGSTLSVLSMGQGTLRVGDEVSGQGVINGTIITAILDFDLDSGTGTYTVNKPQTLTTSSLVASAGIPTTPYTIEFWVKLPDVTASSTPNSGGGLISLGQPSDTAIGDFTAPKDWLLTTSFVVDQITYNQALANNLIPSIPTSISNPSTDVYGWGWAMVADGADTTAMNGTGGNNLYSNAVDIYNLFSGAKLEGVSSFLANYQVSSSQLLGLDGTNTVETISSVPTTQLQFDNFIDSNGQPNSSLNAIAVDTSSSIVNSGFVPIATAEASQSLNNMFQTLWNFQQQTGEAKVNFNLAPDSQGSAGGPMASESYSGYKLDFVVSRGTAVSVNAEGQIVFDIAKGTTLTSKAFSQLDGTIVPSDLRDGNWHYIVASYLPDYQTFDVSGTITQIPTNVGTASLYIDNTLVSSNTSVVDAYIPINLNDQALLLANNAGAAIDQLAFYDKALSNINLPEPLAIAVFTASIADNILTVSSLSSGNLGVGDVISGPGVMAGTSISAVGQVDLATGLGTYTLNQAQTAVAASQQLEAISASSKLPITTFSGSITGNTLTVTQPVQGSLGVGYAITGQGITPGTTITGIIANSSVGTSTFTLNNSQSVATSALVASPSWPTPSAEDALGILASLGYSIATKGPTPGTIPGAVTTHWSAHTVNPDDALLGTYYSVFTPNSEYGVSGTTGVWSNASNLNPIAKQEATPASASQPGSIEGDLVISVPTDSWTNSSAFKITGSSQGIFNPVHLKLIGVQLVLDNKTSTTSSPATIALTPEQVLLGNNSISSLQPLAGSSSNPNGDNGFGYTMLTNVPAFRFVIDKDDLKTYNIATSDQYDATYTFTFETPNGSATYTASNSTPVSFNFAAASLSSIAAVGGNGLATEAAFNRPNALFVGSISGTTLSVSSTAEGSLQVGDVISGIGISKGTKVTAINSYSASTGSGTLTVNTSQTVASSTLGVKGPKYNSVLSTSDIFEQAPLQLKYIDSGEIFKSSSSAAAANSPTVSSPANSFGTTQVFGSYLSNGYTCGWLAIAQPQSYNATSDPAGRIWIQYTGQSKDGKPTTDTANAPSTWLNALSQSNFSPESPNLPLLGDANYPSTTGGLLIQADPTIGWGDNFGQNLIVADVNKDGVQDLVIGAPQANGGGRVYIIDGNWIANNLTDEVNVGTILNLANPTGLVNTDGTGNTNSFVTVLTPENLPDSEFAGFGSALAFDTNTGTLWIGAPNYLQTFDAAANTPAGSPTTVPIGALYSYSYVKADDSWNSSIPTPLNATTLGAGGSLTTLDPTGQESTTFWGSQFGSALAVSGASIAVSAPGFTAGLVYSGTKQARKQAIDGKKDPSDTYGDGALLQLLLPDSSNGNAIPFSQGTGSANLLPVVDQSKNSQKQHGKEESSYMQALKKLQADNIAEATIYYNQALQASPVGAVYLIKDSANLSQITSISADAVYSQGGSTIYGAAPWNTQGSTGFGSSLAFADLTNTNDSQQTLAIGSSQVGGPGAVYFFETNNNLSKVSLGSNQYLAHLAAGLTLYGAESQDYFGSGLVSLGDTNNDGYDDLLIQAYNASNGAGDGYVLFGSDNLLPGNTLNPGSGSVANGSKGHITQADGTTFDISILTQIGYGSSTYTGQGAFGSGDVNGDGLNDVLLGSGPNGSSYLTRGQPYLEQIENLQLNKLASNTGYMLDGLATTTQGSLRSIGDFNGDGYGDFISITPGVGPNGLSTVRLELGANTQETLADYPYNFYSFTVNYQTQVLAAGDINGDGFADIALFIQENLLSSAEQGNQGAGSTTGILFGRSSQDLPVGSGFGFLSPVVVTTADSTSIPQLDLPGLDISGGLSDHAPAVINVGNTLYSVVKGYESTSLWFAQSTDAGLTWSDWTNITSSFADLSSNNAPSLVEFNNKIYLGFINTNEQPGLSISSWDPLSNNPSAWSAPTVLSNGLPGTSGSTTPSHFNSNYTPQLVDRGDALGVIWVDSSDSATKGTLLASFSTTPDNASNFANYAPASAWTAIDNGSSTATPAMAIDGDTVYMAVLGNNNNDENGGNYIYFSSSTDGGVVWSDWSTLQTTVTTTNRPSLAVVNGTLYLSYLGTGNNEINITAYNSQSNSWSTPYAIPGQTATYASLITETVGSEQQLAVYYVSGDPSNRILKAFTSEPSSSSNWTTDVQIYYDSAAAVQSASSPLAVSSFNGQTYIAYQAGTTSSNPVQNTIVLATSSSPSSINDGTSWSCEAAFEPNQRTGIALTSSPDGLILGFSGSNLPNTLQLKLLSPDSSGGWNVIDSANESLPSTFGTEVSILNLDGQGGGSGLLFAGINTSPNGYTIETSRSFDVVFNSSWSTPTQMLEKASTTSTSSFDPITATDAPSLTWLGSVAVLAVNDSGTINVYSALPNSQSWQLNSTFPSNSDQLTINTAPVLATTDTGLALTYGTSDGSINLQRLDVLDAQGNDVQQAWVTTTLNQVTGGLSSNLATVPLSVDGNLLLTSVLSANSEIWLNAIPNIGDPQSVTWLNTTVQLGSVLSQRAGSDNTVGDLVAGTWSDTNIGGASPSLVSFASYEDTVYAAVEGTGANNLWFNISNNNGEDWTGWAELPTGMGTYHPVSIAYYQGMLYLCYISAGPNNLNLTWYDGANGKWASQVSVNGIVATSASMIVEGDNLAIYYTNSSSDILKTYTSTTSPSSNSDWTKTEVYYSDEYGDDFSQTASSNLALTRFNGQTYLAYQGGTSTSPGTEIYIYTAADSVSNSTSSPNWTELSTPASISPNANGIGLTSNDQGLILTYTDTTTPDNVSIQMSNSDVSTWRYLENSQTLSSSVAYTPFITSSTVTPLLIAGVDTNTDIYVQQNQLPLVLSTQQTGSSISAVGDINGDGMDDLLVTANNVAFAQNGDLDSTDAELVTGVRFVLGAGSSQSLAANNSATASEQSVQVAPLYKSPPISSPTPVALLNGSDKLSLNGIQSSSLYQISSTASDPLSSIITANISNSNSLLQLFAGANSVDLGGSFSSTADGTLSLQTLGGFGDLNGDGYVDYLAADGLNYVDTGSASLDFSVWSIRSAGDVNGNGLDDILLALTPKGPAYVAVDGDVSSIVSVLVDGALFNVDKVSNTFNLGDLRAPLNPFSKNEIQDLSSTSSSSYLPLLQNWFEPINLFQPGNVTAVSAATAVNIPGDSIEVPVGVVNKAGTLSLVFSGQSSSSGIWFAYQSSPGTWQQYEIGGTGSSSATSSAQYEQPPSAAYFGGKLYVAWVDTSHNMHISYTDGYQDSGEPVNFANSTWTTYKISGQSTYYAPTLVAEEGRLALYFPSDSGSKNQAVRYMYSSNPDSSSNWGSVLDAATSGSAALPSYTNNNSAILGSFEASSVISATTYQGRTVLAFYNGSTAYLATAPSANPKPNATWDSYSFTTSGSLGGISISTDQSLVYITTSSTVYDDYTDESSSSVYSLQPSEPGNYSSYSMSKAVSGPSSFKTGTSLNTVLLDGHLYATYVNSSNNVELALLDLTVSTPVQQSLLGYSIDGNIDANGDGFTDILLSDPSDPKEGLDNQYVLFGGDYLNIASQVGTAGNDTLIGTPLADVIYSLSGSDTIQSRGGADVIYTGSGNDQIAISDNSFFRIDAGSGFDQLLLEGTANLAYNFCLKLDSPEYFFGTKLRDIELISSQDYGSNVISLDAAAVNAANPDRVLFLTPDSLDFINLTSEFEPNPTFDISYEGSFWYAYAAGPSISSTSNPTLVYVRVPNGTDASTWLASNVSSGPILTSSKQAISSSTFAEPTAELFTSDSAPSSPASPNPSLVAGSKNFGDGLVITAYRTSAGSDVAQFRISRSGDLSASQVISYVSSSINSLLEPGRHYKAVGGVLRFDAGVAERLINVPLEPDALALLGSGTISLEVAELDDLGQKDLHLLFDVDPADQGLRPVLSGLKLEVDGSGNLAAIGFRADTNNPAIDEGLASTLNFKVLRRSSADSSASDPETRSQQLVISEGALAKYDQDGLDNEQVELDFLLNASSGSIQLQPANSQLSSLVLSKLDPAKKAITLGIELTTTSLDAIPVATPPSGVLLNQTAIDFTVEADSRGKAKLFLDLTQVGDDLDISVLEDGVLKRKDKTYLLYLGIDEAGALSPLTYNPRYKAGVRFYDTDGDGIADFVSLLFADGGIGDTGEPDDGQINDPSLAGTVDLLNVLLTAVDSRTLQAADQVNKVAPASLVLRAGLNSRSATANQIYYVVHDSSDPTSFDSIFADIDELRERSQTLYTSLESTDFSLAPGTTLSRDILSINGKHIRFFEVVDGTLDQLTSATDGRLRVFTNSGLSSGGSRSVNLSSTSGVSLALSLVDGDQGLGALIGQEQGLFPVLDFTAFTPDQTIEGTLTLAREADFDSVTGFYRTRDIEGTVWRDPSDLSKGTITPGQLGTTAADYAAAALRNLVDGLTGLHVGNRQTTNRSISLQESTYLAPIAQVKGNTFVAFARGNADGISHFVSLGSNMFGLEDIYGGGDRDFDDQVIGFTFREIVATIA